MRTVPLMAGTELQKHVIVAGHGRSGTNLVLDLFDCHRNTFCRNEPNELAGTGFAGLGDTFFSDTGFAAQAPDFQTRWQEAIHQTIRSCGARDRFGVDKAYFRSPLRARVGQQIMSRTRLRARFLSSPAGQPPEEWPCPGFYYDAAAQARALPVLKMLLTPAWILQAHDRFPSQHVVHVVRPPAGFIQSWWSRYVTGIGGGPEKVFADNLPSLQRILAHFGRGDEMPAVYSERNLLTSELWRWRYMNEVVLSALQGDPRYLLAPYRDVMQDRLGWAERLYDFAGLEMDDSVRAQVAAMQNTLFRTRKPDGLEPDLVAEAVGEVLQDSPWAKTLGDQT